MDESVRRLPVSQPHITEGDKAAVLACLDNNFLSGDSPIVGEFEKKFGSLIGRQHGIAVRMEALPWI